MITAIIVTFLVGVAVGVAGTLVGQKQGWLKP